MRNRYFFIKIIIILSACGLIYYLAFTASGSGFIVRSLLCGYVNSKSTGIKKVEGSLAKGLILHDIQADDLKGFPPDSKIEIQRLEVRFTSFSLKGLNIKVFNGRLKLSQLDTILFYGDYQGAALNFTVYSNVVSVPAALDLFTEAAALKNVSGTLSNIDIGISGPFLEPELSGQLLIEKLSREGFSITDCPVSLSLQLKDIKKDPKLYGEVLLKKGAASGPKTAIVNLQESKILFKGSPKDPSFDLRGTSKVGDTKINLTLKGTIDKPDLRLTSLPPMPQGRLLIMVATNKTWELSSDAASKGELPTNVTKDFLDYFIFSGSGSEIAQHFGISDFSVTLEKDKKGFGLKKAVSDKVDATYAVEQSQTKEQQPAVTQKVGGEYKVTDTISVGAEKELKQDNKTQQDQENQKTNDKVFLKFKKEF